MKTNSLKLLGFLLLISMIISSCGGGAKREWKDHFVVGMQGSPASLDPTGSNDIPSAMFLEMIYDTLVTLDSEMEVKPRLAKSWAFENNNTHLRMFIRSGVKFHNGDTLTAKDIKFSLDRAKASPHTSFVVDVYDRIDVVNDNEILIILKKPFAPILSHLAHSSTSIVSERAIKELGENFARNPIGSGPMKFVSWIAGDRLELVRNNDFWDDENRVAKVSALTVRTISDSTTRLLDLETGAIDIMETPAAADISRIEGDKHLEMLRAAALNLNYIGFNTQKYPFNDVRVRQALTYAINLDAMVKAAYMGVGTVGRGPLPPKVWSSISNELPAQKQDLEKAKQLLAEAGFPNGEGFPTIKFTVNAETPPRILTGEIMQNMLAPLGIHMEVELLEWAAFLDLTTRGEQEMFMLGWVVSTGDPDYGLYPNFHSVNRGAAGNRSFYSNPRVDQLLDQGRYEVNPIKRLEAYEEAQRIIYADAPWIFQQNNEQLWAIRDDIEGFKISPTQRHAFHRVYMEKS